MRLNMKLILISILILFPTVVFAIDCNDPNLDLGPNSIKLCNMLNNIAGALYIIGAGLALIVILFGGITIMTAGGGEDKLKKGKTILLYGLIGTAVVICSGFILQLLAEFLGPLVR